MAANVSALVCFSATEVVIGDWAAAGFIEAAPASVF